MCNNLLKFRSSFKPLRYMALLFFCSPAYSQNQPQNDTTIKISPGTFIQIRDSLSFFSNDTLLELPSSLIPSAIPGSDKSISFYNSLKSKASKGKLTKRIYDLVIVAPDTINSKRITGTSDARYVNYSGKKIRKIEIQRLNVFGTNFSNPASNNPKKFENLLNKTHVNTSERIIRKNLIFHEGDTVFPLILSDNERLLRQLSFINDARIMVVPVSDDEVDVFVLTKDVYSLGASYSYKGLQEGSVSVFEKNILGMGHEFGFDIPFDSRRSDSPGFGVHYLVDNIWKSFVNLNVYFLNGLDEKTYGFSLSRRFLSSVSKYAGGISVRQMSTTVDINNNPVPEPLKYNLQDYWVSRSFLISEEKVSRIIFGARYTNNNVFDRPLILPNSYYSLQKYRMYMGSAALSIQKYYKSNLIYSYGRTEDIPYGGLLKVTLGREFNEFNEFKKRTYVGTEISFGKSNKKLGYFYTSAGLASFINGSQAKQGILSLSLKYFSNLIPLKDYKIRNFINVDYTRGFDRNTDESLNFIKDNGFSGFRNDSISGGQRLSLSLESVLFSPANIYGLRFAFFGFTDLSYLSGTNEIIGNGIALSSIGLGIRIRNDNMVFNTLQIRLSYFPNPPFYSKINNITISGEQLLRPENFDPGPPAIIPYR